MKKYYLALFSILFTTISCGQAFTSVESLYLLSLLDYRYKVSIGGTFFGNFNADVKTVPLSADGKCDRTLSGLGTTTTDDSGGFKVTYSRTSQSGGYVCVISSPKADGTSRFFAVDRQQSFAWTGDAYNVMILPEPNTTSRSQFNVVSTMFNRMATQKLEKLAEGNKDLSRAGTLLKTSNKQIVSQFGLSKGISKSLTKTTLQDALQRVLYSEQRASSIEDAIPDLNDIPIDFTKKDNPVTLKFTVIIGGIQSLADPNDPSSYDKVVNIISKVVASGNKSEAIVFPGGATLSAGGSFGALVSTKIQSFVQSQGASLGLSATEINNIKEEAVQLASAIDNPPIGSASIDKPLYAVETNTYKIGEKITINPQVAGGSGFQITEVCIVTCQPVGASTSDFIQLSSTTGVITGTIPTNIPGDVSFQLRISATRSGASTTGVVNLSFRGKPNLSYTGTYLANSGTFDSPVITIGPLPVGNEFSFTPTVIGANPTLSSSGFPAEKCITFSAVTGKISGNFSCITSETSSQVTVTNDIGSRIYSVKFVPNSKPTVANLGVSGTLLFQNTVTGTYTYNDAQTELGSTFAWYICPTALGTCEAITSASNKTYTIQASDVGKYLKFQVTPKDNFGLVGDAVLSSAVLVQNRAPSISSVSITNVGNIYAGDTLNSSTSGYSDPENTPSGTFVYNWFRCSTQSSCDTTPSGTSSTYVTSTSDGGKLIKLQVSPVDNLGAVGTPVIASQFVSIIQAPAQCLSYTSKTGSDRHIGLLGTGSSCDNTTNGSWVRFDSIYSIIPNAIVASSSCGTDATGYLTTDHPITLFQQVSGTVCYNWSGNACSWTNQISITKCNGYYVYQLPNTPACSLRYCTTAISISNPSYNSVGSTLQGSYGELFTSQNIPQYNWLRCDSSAGSNCVTISGATTSSYTITSNDIGKFLQFQVTPVNGAPVKSQIVQVFNPNQDLVLYMPFNGNFNDESSSPMPISFYNSPNLIADRKSANSNAYSSNGDSYMIVSNVPSKISSLITNYTMSAWINLDADKTGTHGIFSRWHSTGYGLILRVNNYFLQNENFNCQAIPANQWVHVVGTVVGTTARLYVNGVTCKNQNGGELTGSVSNLYVNSDPLTIGSDHEPSRPTRALKGKMDDLRLYNRALSASEVLSLYNYEK